VDIAALPHPAERTLAVIAKNGKPSASVRAVMRALLRKRELPVAASGVIRMK
jgi:hypothetical protein